MRQLGRQDRSNHRIGAKTKLCGWLVMMTLCAALPAQAAPVSVQTGADALINGDRFQSALDSAQCGDTIILQAGATYATRTAFVSSSGPQGYAFSLPNKNCAGQYITVMTSNLTALPADGIRVSPTDAPAMAKLVTSNAQAVVAPARSSGYYRFVGIEFTNAPSVAAQGGHVANLFDNPDAGYFPYGTWAHHIVIDRCFFHPIEDTTNPLSDYRSVTRGVQLDGAEITIQNSYFSGFTGWYWNTTTTIPSIAILSVSGPGPYHIVNNFLEAWYNNLFTGGGTMMTANTATVVSATASQAVLSNAASLSIGDLIAFSMADASWQTAKVTALSGTTVSYAAYGASGITQAPAMPGGARWNGLNVADIEIRHNTFYKRIGWDKYGVCKSFYEMKSGVRVVMDGNIFDGYPCNAFMGTQRNQTGDSPWSIIRDLTISNNWFKHTDGLIIQLNDNYQSTAAGANVTIRNNVIGSSNPKYTMVQTEGGANVLIQHNTVRGNTNSMLFGVTQQTGVTFKDNLLNSGAYWFACTVDGMVSTCWPGLTQAGNLIINTSGSSAPSSVIGAILSSNDAGIGFANLVAADSGDDYRGYALASTSSFKGRASDGMDPGADLTAFAVALAVETSSGPAAPSNLQAH